MSSLAMLIPITVVACIAVRVWIARNRDRCNLADLVSGPWWRWPLDRLMIRAWKNAADDDDLWKFCGYRDPPRTTSYISIRGREWRDGWIRPRKRVPWIKLRLAPGFPQGDEEFDGRKNPKKELIAQARGEFELGLVDYAFNFRFLCRHVVLTPRKVVPQVAPGLEPDIAALVAANIEADTVVPALGAGDEAVKHSTTDDASHVLISGTTMGGGKSETLKTFGLQSYAPTILAGGRAIPGADLLIVDTTRKFSHTGWAIDYATGEPWLGITICTELDDAADMLVLAAQVMEERGTITHQAKLRGETVEWPRLLIMLDDSNGLQKQLKDGGYDQALGAISMLLWHARGVNMYLVAAFQRGSARAAGGGDNREAFGCRIWADGSEKTGDMLADGADRKTRPKPKPHKIQPGHAVFIYGSHVFEAQRIIYTDAEARSICAAEDRRRRRLALGAGHVDGTTGQEHGYQPDGYSDDNHGHDLGDQERPGIDGPKQLRMGEDDGRGAQSEDGPEWHGSAQPQVEGNGANGPDHDDPGVTDQPAQPSVDGYSESLGHSDRLLDGLEPDPSVPVDPSEHRSGFGQLGQGGKVIVGEGEPVSVDPVASVPGSHDDEPAEAVDLAAGHVRMVQHHDDVVKSQAGADDEGENRSGVPGSPGLWAPTAAVRASTFRPPTDPPPPGYGFSHSEPSDLSVQAIQAISQIDESDGEVNYLTLRDIAKRDWCPWKYHTIRKYASDPEMGFPAPIEGFSNPRRWSERAVRDWLESREPDAGKPGVYVIEPPHDLKVKIGWTKRLEGRIDEFSWSAIPQEELVKHWFPCRDRKHAEALEDWFRKKYGHSRIGKTEWHRKEGRLAADLYDDERMLAGCPSDIAPLSSSILTS